MPSKFIFIGLFMLLILEVRKPLESQAEKNITENNLINRICLARLKSKLYIKNKQNFDEISHFTCECFYKKYYSGTSLKGSRLYCKNKASEKYNL